MTMNRRQMLKSCTAIAVGHTLGARALGDDPKRSRLGVVEYSFGIRMANDRRAGRGAGISDPLAFAEHCHQFDAGGIQLGLGQRDQAYLSKLKDKLTGHRMYIEGSIRLPQDEKDRDRFTTELQSVKDAGATVVRTVLTTGRRYEVYDSAEAFRLAWERAKQSLALAEPIAARLDMRLAIENHKDWRINELTDMLRRLGSGHVGVCVDTGNSIALLEEPHEVVDAYARYAFSVHLKDMAVAEYEDGFLLAEVPLGEGFLDLKRIVTTLRKALPEIRFNLEMMTRDPLKVPCLTDKYWATAENVPGRDLARTLAMVKKHQPQRPLVQVSKLTKEQQLALEKENVRKCFAYMRKELEL